MNQLTPLGVDPYSRLMAMGFDEKQIIGVPTAFQAFFGRPETGGKTLFSPNANVVDIDIVRGNEKTAVFIHRGQNARSLTVQKNTNDGKSSAFSRKYPLGEEEGDISADQLNFRQPSENPYAVNVTRFDRLRKIALGHHQEHIRRFVRLFERLGASSILTGQMPAILGAVNADLIYDFRRNAANTAAGAAVWDTGTPDIMADIEGRCDKVRQNGHANPDMMIMGAEAISSFVKDTTVQGLADNRRIEMVQVGTQNPVPPRMQRFVDAGLIPRGTLRTPKGYTLWMFSYIDGYETDADVFTPYMPVDQVLVAASTARCDRYFGPSATMPMTPGRVALYQEMFGFAPGLSQVPQNIKNPGDLILPEMFYNDAYVRENQTGVTIRTQSAPIFAPTQTDAFALLTDLST